MIMRVCGRPIKQSFGMYLTCYREVSLPPFPNHSLRPLNPLLDHVDAESESKDFDDVEANCVELGECKTVGLAELDKDVEFVT
jgi:hypothetical protein